MYQWAQATVVLGYRPDLATVRESRRAEDQTLATNNRHHLALTFKLPGVDEPLTFITTRSLHEDGLVIWEDVSLERGGKAVDGVRARRVLRRSGTT